MQDNVQCCLRDLLAAQSRALGILHEVAMIDGCTTRVLAYTRSLVPSRNYASTSGTPSINAEVITSTRIVTRPDPTSNGEFWAESFTSVPRALLECFSPHLALVTNYHIQ